MALEILILAGYFPLAATGSSSEAFVSKLDNTGNFEWAGRSLLGESSVCRRHGEHVPPDKNGEARAGG